MNSLQAQQLKQELNAVPALRQRNELRAAVAAAMAQHIRRSHLKN